MCLQLGMSMQTSQIHYQQYMILLAEAQRSVADSRKPSSRLTYCIIRHVAALPAGPHLLTWFKSTSDEYMSPSVRWVKTCIDTDIMYCCRLSSTRRMSCVLWSCTCRTI